MKLRYAMVLAGGLARATAGMAPMHRKHHARGAAARDSADDDAASAAGTGNDAATKP